MAPARDPGFFRSVYDGPERPPWDVDGPQPAVVRLAEAGAIGRCVLDVGCGTGENALFLAAHGHEVWGVDAVPAAIHRAEQKAKKRGLLATFQVADALALNLGETFDTVIDTGLFHIFDDADRARLVRSLEAALRPDGRYHLLCFSEHEPDWGGPRRVSQAEIGTAFTSGVVGAAIWQVESIVDESFVHNLEGGHARAWLASIRRA